MSKIKYSDLLEEMHNLNAMLEVCQGCTQADQPNLESLDISLYCLHTKYAQLYEQLLTYGKEGAGV